MANPHDHMNIVASLREATKEVKTMPKIPKTVIHEPTIVEPELYDEPMPEEEEFDLEDEFERVSALLEEQAQATAVPEPQMVSPEAQLRDQILQLLQEHPDKPSVAQIDAWKEKFGKEAVQVLALDSDNVYIYTHLTWAQWERVQKLSEQIQKQANADAEKAMREAIVRQAVLWPKLGQDFFQKCRAGLPATLMDQIMIASYFLSPQQAMSLTTRL